MRKDKSSGGSTLIIVTLFLPVIIGLSALSIDVGYFHWERSRLEAVADLATLSALGNVDWNGREADDEEEEINQTIQSVLTANGFDSSLLGTPTYTVREGNVERIEIDQAVPLSAFFSKIVLSESQNFVVRIRTVAEVEYDNSGSMVAPDYAIYGLKRVYIHSSSSVVATYNSTTTAWVPPGVPPNASTTEIAIGSGDLIYFNGTGSYPASFYAYNEIQASGGPTIEYNAVSPFIDFAVNVDGDRDIDSVPLLVCPPPAEPLPNDNHEIQLYGGSKASFSGDSITIKNGGTMVLKAGGNYVFDDIDLKNGGEIEIDNTTPVAGASAGDPVKIYVRGSLSAAGQFVQNSNQMKIYGLNTDTVARQSFDIGGNADTYIDLYAPCADVVLRGSGIFYGRIYGYDVDIQASFYFDQALASLGLEALGQPQVVVPAHLVN